MFYRLRLLPFLIIVVPSFSALPSYGEDEASPTWSASNRALSYAVPDSDIVSFIARCPNGGGRVQIFITIRPLAGKSGDRAPIAFRKRDEELRYTAVLTEVDGISGDDVRLDLPISAKLFSFIEGSASISVHVDGSRMQLPALNGKRERSVRAFRRSCGSQSG